MVFVDLVGFTSRSEQLDPEDVRAILTITAVVATLPLALIPALNGLGWHSLGVGDSNTVLHTQLVVIVATDEVVHDAYLMPAL